MLGGVAWLNKKPPLTSRTCPPSFPPALFHCSLASLMASFVDVGWSIVLSISLEPGGAAAAAGGGAPGEGEGVAEGGRPDDPGVVGEVGLYGCTFPKKELFGI